MDITIKYRERIEKAKEALNARISEASAALGTAFQQYNDAGGKAIKEFEGEQIAANDELVSAFEALGLVNNGSGGYKRPEPIDPDWEAKIRALGDQRDSVSIPAKVYDLIEAEIKDLTKDMSSS